MANTGTVAPAAGRGGTFRAYLQLLRPANVVTAMADVCVGAAAATAVAGNAPVAAPEPAALAALVAASACLYGGGVVLNDVFDAALDARERPERPIPSGRATRGGAALFGGSLLVLAVALASLASVTSGLVAAAIAGLVLLYDGRFKHSPWLGPPTMGMCRGANLLLGISAVAGALAHIGYLALIPLVYVIAITAVSRGEVHGGDRRYNTVAVLLVVGVITALLALGALEAYRLGTAVPFIALYAAAVLPKFGNAARNPSAKASGAAVKRGVLSVVLLDAAMAAGFGGVLLGLGILALLPISLWLARHFAVT